MAVLIQAVFLILAVAFIVLSSELFTNGIEWLGQRLKLGEGVVGSVLAAVGTALPETLIPFVAVIFFGQRHGAEVGIGAITGAPFMLSTLTLAICGVSILIFARTGTRSVALKLNERLISHDLQFFLIAYSLALLGSLASDMPVVRQILAIVLFGIYPYYVYDTIRHEQEVGSQPEQLHFDRLLKLGKSDRLTLIVPQVVAGIVGIIAGAWIFVDNVEKFARGADLAPLVLSLVVSPIATELPEKVNSVLWARRGKDTLALANITGAMVFQSCIPVAFGVAFTNWHLDKGTLATGVVALVSATTYFVLLRRKKLVAQHLLWGGVAYLILVSILVGFDLANVTPPPDVSCNYHPANIVHCVQLR